MNRGFAGVNRPLLANMIAGHDDNQAQQTKQIIRKAIAKLVKKVKKLENILKRRNVVITTSEDEEPEDQGRIFKDIDDDPLVSFVTLTKPSGEAQEEEISPTTLEAAKTLPKVASQRSKSVDKGKRYKRRKEFKGKDFEDISTGFKEVNTSGLGFSTGSGLVSSGRGQREGKAPIIIEETQAPKRTKEQIQQEEASLAEAIILQNLEEEETAKQVHLDALLAKRLAEKEELTEQQKQRKAQVQFGAQHYTKEDWDAIRAKLEANAELAKIVISKDMSEEDFVKKMVELVNQRKKYFAEEMAKAKRRTWKLSQLKKLKFEEIKEEFDKLVKQVDTFVPMNLKATKAELKRFSEELQTKTTKRKKIDDKAKKDKASEEDDSSSGTNVLINPVLVAVKSPSIACYKIIKQGKKGVYQIVRENGTNKVYMSLGAILKEISREDLTELYRIVMKRYGTEGPTDDYDRVFWENLKIMFDAPLSTDLVWSLPERKYPLSANVCQTMLKMKLLDGKMNEDCYKLLKMMEKQAGSTMSNRHKDWLVQEQTALGKDFSNPFMADNLPKIVWLSTHHIYVCKELASPQVYGLWKIIMLQFKNNSKDNAHKILKKLIMKTLKETLRSQSEVYLGGLLGIIVNRLKSGSYRVKSGRHS
ncbi:hypothetical protein Tco_1046890 [Tanacetum coccineum]